ncbi:hypothetical protein BP5796_11318 [Coleophoma crateriformis]|uniref:Deacetylase sirtuin-type domain-containing protein n=1 Tax=Coleophoma crateriformis TaxID=565419 RepID=A0A3D8QHV6_9HELO|nr:hypothetical protein BP5796_11318 [Coleophoma crateriformis]
MGQENSQLVDDSIKPRALESRSLDSVAKFIKDGKASKIVIMTGAGISTSAGIPDFRSPKTGLYSNLARLNLPHPEAVFDISFFRGNPNPFYVLAKELYPGKFSPTVSHAFIALLERKGMLEMLFTQNIDCLERKAGVSPSKIIEAHGSFATQRCIDCKTEYPDDLMLQAVDSGDVPHCITPQCNGLVKPDIVFFGEGLPESFFHNIDVPSMADLVIVMGTSLTVAPFSQLPGLAREGVPRLLFNLERVGDLGSRPDDVCILGDCDNGVRKLAEALGWGDELEELWRKVAGKDKEEALAAEEERRRENLTRDELLEEEIAKLTGDVDKTLQMSNDHKEWVSKDLEEDLKAIKPGAGAAALESIDVAPESAASQAAVSLLARENAEEVMDSWREVTVKDNPSAAIHSMDNSVSTKGSSPEKATEPPKDVVKPLGASEATPSVPPKAIAE